MTFSHCYHKLSNHGKVMMLWPDQVAFNNWLKMLSVEDMHPQLSIPC